MLFQYLKNVLLPCAVLALLAGVAGFAPLKVHAQAADAAQEGVDTSAADEEASSDPTPIEKPAAKPKKTSAKHKKKRSKDFYEAHKNAAAKPALKNAVGGSDLMQAMRQNIQPDAPMLVPEPPAPQTAAAPSVGAQMKPMPAAQLGQNAATPSVPLAPAPVVQPALPEVRNTAPVAAPSTPQIEVKKDAPAKADSAKPASGAPLLSDLDEAPNVLGADKPVIDAPTAKAEPRIEKAIESKPDKTEAAKSPEPAAVPSAPPGFSKPRKLFSSPDDNALRPGITRVMNEASAAAQKEDIYTGSAAPELPPVPAPAEKSSIITPVTASAEEKTEQKNDTEKKVDEKKGIWEAPKPDMDRGKVIYSQSADGAKQMAPDEEANAEPPKVEEQAPSKSEEEPKEEKKSETVISEEKVVAEEPSPVVEPAPAAPKSAPEEMRTQSGKYNPAAGPMLHGSCGAVNGVGTATKPTSNLCTQGSATAVSGKGPWSWTCQGSNGGTTVKCGAPLQINGECGMANGSQSASPPPGKLCASGKATSITGNGPWYWSCFGDNGGVTAQCVAYTLVSGVCGPANNVPTDMAPAAGLCSSGSETAVLGSGPWSWSCVGSGENTTANCTAPSRRSGECGTANGVGTSARPQGGLCSSGVASAVSGNGPWSWSCTGENGGASAACSAPILLNAACGAAHGAGTNSMPTDNLCASGRASPVAGNGPWNWTCLGENGGAMVNCMAPKKLDGVCGAAHLNGSSEIPRDGLCLSGIPSTVSGTGPWQWSCQGAGGGITANCISQPLVHAACGAAHGVSVTAPPTANLCAQGTPTTIIGAGPFMWSCQGEHGGSAVNCMAPLQVNGACGVSDGVPSAAMPTANLCATGGPSTVTGNGPWIWTCQGANGGISSTCQAPLMTASTPAAAETPAPAASAPTPAATPESAPEEAITKAGNECTPTVKRWTITCQQGGYPSNYTGVIVGETQVLCPTNVERGVWLSNSCAAATNSAPVSPSPGKLEVPPPPPMPKASVKLSDTLPQIAPMPAKELAAPRKLFTPHFKAGAEQASGTAAAAYDDSTPISFAQNSEALDTTAVSTIDNMVEGLRGDDKSIITLSAYAAVPADGNQQESRRLALARALSIRSYLMRKGLPSNRIDVRALGPATDSKGDDRVDIKVK